MLRLICSTMSIAAVLGVLVIGCGSETPSVAAAGSVAPGSGAGGVDAKGTAGGGSVNIPPANNGQGQGGSSSVGGSSAPTIENLCGNGQIDGEEECDKDVYATPNDSCALHLDGTEGELSCDDRCAVDVSACLPVDNSEATTGDGYDASN